MDTAQLQHLLMHSDWMSDFDSRTLDRGDDYARRDKVLSLSLSGEGKDSCALEGRISGSNGQEYACRIAIDNHDDLLTLDADCTCPVGMDCKHAAAMLLTALNLPADAWGEIAQSTPAEAPVDTPEWLQHLKPRQRGEVGPDADAKTMLRQWSQWLEELDSLRSGSPAPVEAQRRFGVLLRTDKQDDGLLVSPVWLRPGKAKTGALVDPKPLHLDPEHGPQPAPAQGWSPAIAGALALVLQDNYIRAAGLPWTRVHAAWQEQALEMLLEHAPVYHQKGAHPIERGPNRSLTLQWRDQPDGSQRLTAQVQAVEPAILLRGAGLWYVLPGHGIYGRVDGDPRILDGIDFAPPVAPEQVNTLRRQLQKRKSKGVLPVPLPAERGPVRTISARPTPILHMRTLTMSLRTRGGQRQSTPLGCARLSFDYNGQRLAPDPDAAYFTPTRIFEDGQVLEVTRDADAERQAITTLDSAGLVDAVFVAYEHNTKRNNLDANDFLLQPNERRPPLDVLHWKPVLKDLVERGFRIEYDASFPHDQLLDIDDWHADIEASGNAWFDVSLGIDVGGERIDMLPLLRRLLADPDFPRVAPKSEKKNATYRVLIDENRSVKIPLKRLRALIEPLLEWLEGDGELRLHRSQAPALRELADDADLTWRGGDALRKQLQLLGNAERSTKAPRGFKATLRPYQREGLAWLDFLGDAGLGGILADDMGLGKTVQVLAHIVAARQRKQLDGPVLVVAPTSLVGNWRDETARFAPRLKTLVIHGADRADRYDEIADHHLIITTYPLLPRDRDKLVETRFSLLVLDEAQAIKNPRSQAAQVVREIPADRRLAMTGTPLENHLGELWAQFDAVEPGLLGSRKQFTKLYRTPIEKHADSDRQQRLNRRVGPLLLRRRKDQVLTDLPAKNEIVRTLELEGDQRSLYETLRLAQHERVQQTIKERGLSQAGIIVLDALLKLRQACCDPRLVKLASAKKVKNSAKLDALLELIDGLVDEGRRILLFSQFTEMLGLIETALKKRRIVYQILTGQTPGSQRGDRVQRFQQGDVPLFLISLKAGGIGLNLTAADTVIHYDPWWNPAVEAQATDRAHRIGQDKPVFVYRLICAGTVEEKIQAMQARKSDLARALLEGGASQRLRFDEADLAELFAPL